MDNDTSINRRVLVTLAIVAVVVAGTSGLAYAAAPSVSSGTDTGAPTGSDSELKAGDTITYNESTNSTLTYQADSPNSSVEIRQNGSYLLSTFENGTADEMTLIGTDDGGDEYINLTLADDETAYAGVEADAGANITMEYRLINDTELDNPDTTNVTLYWENDDNKSFIRGESDETETAEVGLTASIASSIPLVGSKNTTNPAKVEQDIGVNGADQEEITVYVESTDAEDALTETYDSADADSDVTYDGWVTVEGEFVPVLSSADNAPDWIETDNETYATVNSDGSEVVIHNAGDKLDSNTENATVQVVGNEAMSIFQIKGMVKSYGGDLVTQVSEMLGGEATSVRDQFSVAGA